MLKNSTKVSDQSAVLIYMSKKFYDIQPGDGSHYVCENGKQIARFDHLPQAESLRETLMRRQAQKGGYIS